MKKIAALSAMLALVCTVTACSSGRESSITMNEAQYADDGKPIITVGSFGFFDSAFSDYLAFPQDYHIKNVNYMNGDTTYEQAAWNLDLDVIQGNSPDIIFAPPEKMYNYIRKGALTDLYSLMDDIDGLKREDFLPNVLEGLTIDGELPAVVDSFNISTAVAKTKFVGEEYTNWTPEQAIQFYNDLPAGRSFIGDDDYSLPFYMLRNTGKGCVDYTSFKCNFAGSNFADILRFCAEHPYIEGYVPDYSTMSVEEMAELSGGSEPPGYGDSQLVFPVDIIGINHALAIYTYGDLNREDVTFVGLPSNDGNGAKTYVNLHESCPYGIMKSCSNKEDAWKLMCQLLRYRKKLDENLWDDTRGVPVLMSQLDLDFDRSESYHSSINGVMHPPGESDEDGGGFHISQEAKDKLRDYILSVKIDIYYPDEVSYIIDEESDPVLAGERTPEQAAKILDNRITTILSEKA